MKASVVIPAYNEERALSISLPIVYEQLLNAQKNMIIESFEIIVVNDGSVDETKSTVLKFNEKFMSVDTINSLRLIEFSKNQGHMKAISTGMSLIHGDFVITLDADLQDPPEVIPEIISLYRTTLVPCIQTFRIDRRSDTLWKRKTAHLYYKLMNRITGVQVIPHAADFRLLARKEAIMLAELTESKKIFRLLIPYFDIKTLHFPIERGSRVAGESKYSFGKMVALAFDSLLSFSTRPLRWILFLSLSSLVLFLGFSGYALLQWTRGDISRGWTSLSLLISFGFTATLVSLFIIGEYVSRIYLIALNRPGAMWSEVRLR